MSGVRLILALHNHQPVGNFDDVFEGPTATAICRSSTSWKATPRFRSRCTPRGRSWSGWPSGSLNTSPECALVEAGRVEILGGGFYEPIMTMIPHRDRVGQIRTYSNHLNELLGARIRGMWMPERVWEQHLVVPLAEAGIEYTVLDDFHFQRAGLNDAELYGYYLTEDDGQLLKVFPGSERLRYTIPFQEPHATYEYLRHLAEHHPRLHRRLRRRW